MTDQTAARRPRAQTIRELDEPAFVELYGPWARRTPADVAALFADYPGRWWIAGGWAIEAFTGVVREHDDIDPSVLRSDLPALRRHLDGKLDIWSAADGALRPLLPAEDELEGAIQVWTRPHALAPWEYDILLTPGTPQEWVYRRDESIRLPMAEALWTLDGIPYLRPEIQLLYKAAGLRTKDQSDFEATAPLLDSASRTWLRTQLVRTLPGHRWIAAL